MITFFIAHESKEESLVALILGFDQTKVTSLSIDQCNKHFAPRTKPNNISVYHTHYKFQMFQPGQSSAWQEVCADWCSPEGTCGATRFYGLSKRVMKCGLRKM
jgi:hypothetical protein